MGDQGVPGLEALGVLRLLPLHPLPGHHLPLCHAAPAPLLHRQRHHSLPALLLLNRPGVLPAHRLRWVQLLTLMDLGLLFWGKPEITTANTQIQADRPKPSSLGGCVY